MDDQAPKKQPPSTVGLGVGLGVGTGAAPGAAPGAGAAVAGATGGTAGGATGGTAVGSGTDDRPRLRPLEAFAVNNPNPADRTAQKLLTLRDPSGVAEGTVTLPPMGVAVIDLCDGTRSRDQICAEFRQRYQVPLDRPTLDALLTRLDDALMLDSTAFRNRAARTFGDFAKTPVRPAFFAGKSYPAQGPALYQQLESYFAPPNGPGQPAGDAGAPCPAAIVAPHVDFHRGGPAYAWAYRPLLEAAALPDLIVLLGTDHSSPDPGFTLTRKHFATPLGEMETDIELVDQLLSDARAASAGAADKDLAALLLRDEHHHRGEHSLEFQAVWLRYVLARRGGGPEAQPDRRPKLLPILCGSLHDFVAAPGGKDPDPARNQEPGPTLPFLSLLTARIAERRAAGQQVLFIAAADLAHVGPRYGDQESLDATDCASLERRDRETLRPVCAGDADGWFRELRREGDRRRVCGLGPIYALLKATPLQGGSLRCYAQCPAEAGSIVSVATLVF